MHIYTHLSILLQMQVEFCVDLFAVCLFVCLTGGEGSPFLPWGKVPVRLDNSMHVN